MRTYKNASMHANLEYEGAVTFVSIREELRLKSKWEKEHSN